jgi:hypothetical protein
MKRTATTLCVAALAATPAIAVACPDGGSGDANANAGQKASSGVSAAASKRYKRCKRRAYQRYQGPDLTKALKRCKRKYG